MGSDRVWVVGPTLRRTVAIPSVLLWEGGRGLVPTTLGGWVQAGPEGGGLKKNPGLEDEGSITEGFTGHVWCVVSRPVGPRQG